MTNTIFPATLLCDFYKVNHREQYPDNTQYIYSTFTPRSNKYFPITDEVVVFGIQSFVKKYLIEYFNKHFFSRDKGEVVAEYERLVRYALGVEKPYSKHIEELHDLGYLPIRLKALKEGTLAPIQTPVLTVENTNPKFFWLTNYLETLISTELWQPMTSATIAKEYRKILDEYAIKTSGHTEGVDYQAHDFSMRGMSSLESAVASSAGHMTSFVGCETIPAIFYLENYYNANVEKEIVGTGIPATEHSVMCANADADIRDEFDSFKRLITEVYPNGFVSIVSDTYDFWKVIGEVLPKLKSDIMNRDGRVVIRPDSGDPVKIIVGDPEANTELERKGLIEALWDIFGGAVNELGYKVLDPHIGAIYGDSITLERAEQILKGLEEKGFASNNIVLGVGSYSYQYNTRDTFGFAMKATYAVVDGEERMLFKDPKTDQGKRSQRGRVVVSDDMGNIPITTTDGLDLEGEGMVSGAVGNLLETVFEDGVLKREQTLAEIREIING